MKLIDQKKPPCSQCPYKLRLIETLINPCPQCMENDYQTFERFKGDYSAFQNASSQKNQ